MTAWLWWHRLKAMAAVLSLAAAGAVAADIVLRTIAKQANGAFHGTPWHLTTGAPSGHACVSVVVYGSIGALFARHATGAVRWIAGLLTLAVIAGVEITRVSLGYHSQADVSTGVLLGGVFTFAVLSAPTRPAEWPPMGRLLLALVVAGAVMQATGVRFDSTAVL